MDLAEATAVATQIARVVTAAATAVDRATSPKVLAATFPTATPTPALPAGALTNRWRHRCRHYNRLRCCRSRHLFARFGTLSFFASQIFRFIVRLFFAFFLLDSTTRLGLESTPCSDMPTDLMSFILQSFRRGHRIRSSILGSFPSPPHFPIFFSIILMTHDCT